MSVTVINSIKELPPKYSLKGQVWKTKSKNNFSNESLWLWLLYKFLFPLSVPPYKLRTYTSNKINLLTFIFMSAFMDVCNDSDWELSCSWFTHDYIAHLFLIYTWLYFPFALDSPWLYSLPICSWFTLDYITHLFLIYTWLYCPFVLDLHNTIFPICFWFTHDYIAHLFLIHLDYVPYPFVLDSHMTTLPICFFPCQPSGQ